MPRPRAATARAPVPPAHQRKMIPCRSGSSFCSGPRKHPLAWVWAGAGEMGQRQRHRRDSWLHPRWVQTPRWYALDSCRICLRRGQASTRSWYILLPPPCLCCRIQMPQAKALTMVQRRGQGQGLLVVPQAPPQVAAAPAAAPAPAQLPLLPPLIQRKSWGSGRWVLWAARRRLSCSAPQCSCVTMLLPPTGGSRKEGPEFRALLRCRKPCE